MESVGKPSDGGAKGAPLMVKPLMPMEAAVKLVLYSVPVSFRRSREEGRDEAH